MRIVYACLLLLFTLAFNKPCVVARATSTSHGTKATCTLFLPHRQRDNPTHSPKTIFIRNPGSSRPQEEYSSFLEQINNFKESRWLKKCSLQTQSWILRSSFSWSLSMAVVPQEMCIITYSASKCFPAVLVTSESYTGYWIRSKSDFSLDSLSYPLLSDTDDLSIFKV